MSERICTCCSASDPNKCSYPKVGMTPTERLTAIAEILRPLIEAREKATKGEWAVDGWCTDHLLIQVDCIATNDRPDGKRFLQLADFNFPGSFCGTDPQRNSHFVSVAANLDYAEIKRILGE